MERQNCLIVLNSIICGIYFITLVASRCLFNAFYMKWGAKLIIFGSNTITFGAFFHYVWLEYDYTRCFSRYIQFKHHYIWCFLHYIRCFFHYWFKRQYISTFVVMIVTSLPCGRRVRKSAGGGQKSPACNSDPKTNIFR